MATTSSSPRGGIGAVSDTDSLGAVMDKPLAEDKQVSTATRVQAEGEHPHPEPTPETTTL